MPRKAYVWMLACGIFLSASLLLQWNGHITAIDGAYDSVRYLGMAESLAAGKWLGAYNQMTLIRPPMYPAFLAINSWMGWPLERSQALVYLTSVALLLGALQEIGVAGWRIAVVCLLCAFHPTELLTSEFVASEGIYTSISTMLLAGCLGVMGAAANASDSRLFLWLCLLSVSAACFWHIRPESIWIVPFGGIYILYLCRTFRKSYRQKWLAVSGAVLLPCLSVCMMTLYLENRNAKEYGVHIVQELNEPNIVSAFAWLTRIDGGKHHPYIPVTNTALSQAYEVSPHFALLKPFLSQQTGGKGWSRYGCEWMNVCDELSGGWLIWAVRDAAASIGVYESAVSASRFYGRVAHEIQTACREGRITCTHNPTGNMLGPPIMWTDVPRILVSCAKMLALTVRFEGLAKGIEAVSHMQPPAGLVARYNKITHDQFSNKKNISVSLFVTLIRIFEVIQVIGGVWMLVVTGKNGRKWWTDFKSGLTDAQQKTCWVVGGLMSYILARIAVVAYIDAMSFYAQIRYVMVIYPALMTLMCFFIPGLSLKKSFHRRSGSMALPKETHGIDEHEPLKETGLLRKMALTGSNSECWPRSAAQAA